MIPAIATDPQTDETVEITPAVYDAGIQKILDAWDEMIGRSGQDRRGELRSQFYSRLKRGATEGVPNYALL